MSSARVQAVGVAAALLGSGVDAVRQTTVERMLETPAQADRANATESVSMATFAQLLSHVGSGETLIEPCGGNIKARWNQAATADEIRELIREDRIWSGMDNYLKTNKASIEGLEGEIGDLEQDVANVAPVTAKPSVSPEDLKAILLTACQEALKEPLAEADETDIEDVFSAVKLGTDQQVRLPVEIKKGVKSLDECVILGYGYRTGAMDTAPAEALKAKAVELLAGKKLGDSKAKCEEYLNCNKYTFNTEDFSIDSCEDMEMVDDLSAEKICEFIADETAAEEEEGAQDNQIEKGGLQGQIKRLAEKKTHMESMQKGCADMQADFQEKLKQLEDYDNEFKTMLNDEQGFDSRLSELHVNLEKAFDMLAKAKDDLEAAITQMHLSCDEAERLNNEVHRILEAIESIKAAIAHNRAHLRRVEHQLTVVVDAKMTAFEMAELMARMKESIKEFVKQTISEPIKAIKEKLGTQESNFPAPSSLKGPMEESAMGVVEACHTHKRALEAVKLAGDNSHIAFAAEGIETLAPVNYSSADLKSEVTAFEGASRGRSATGLADICDNAVASKAEAKSAVRGVLEKIAAMQATPKRAFGEILTSLEFIVETIEDDDNWEGFVATASQSATFDKLLQGSAIMEKFQHLTMVGHQADVAVETLRKAIEALKKLIEDLKESHKSLLAQLAALQADLARAYEQLAKAEEQCQADKDEVANLREYIKQLEEVVRKTQEAIQSVEQQLAELQREVQAKEADFVSTFKTKLLA
eukprot:TRINITY_DN7226_c0_g1_i4.p1 TRINITY_DN7226_c0_g1~~TRINITY_DN7226_c0_g1_i4.p1  ORF type:complete len:788 (-),score=260.28 TRINITY_DN7226_c0_g1_i4:182-2452(-)